MKKTIREKVIEQIELVELVQTLAKINIVDCGSCGSMLLHRMYNPKGDHVTDVECPYCHFIGDPSDFPDFLYSGVENSTQFDEPTNTIEDLKTLSTQIDDELKDKLDRVYNEVLFPKMKDVASRLKVRSWTTSNSDEYNSVVKELFGENGNLAGLMRSTMKPYLLEKGFKLTDSIGGTTIYW